jgi:hypothetical protein
MTLIDQITLNLQQSDLLVSSYLLVLSRPRMWEDSKSTTIWSISVILPVDQIVVDLESSHILILLKTYR